MKLNILITLLLLTVFVSAQADEQIIFEEQPQTIQVTQQPIIAEPQQPITPTPSRKFEFNQETLYLYSYQIVAIITIFVYLIMYRRGRSENSSLIQAFYKHTRTYFQQNFAHIGFSKNHGEDPFIAESANEAMFYASGRNSVDYIQINFNMRKRQDLLYSVLYEIIYPEKDLITINIPVHCDTPLVFALSHKKKLKNITETCLDLSQLTRTFDIKNLNQNFQILGQSAETVDFLIDNHVVKKVNELTSLILSIHYTDQKMFSDKEGHLKVVFLASKKNEEKYRAAIQLVFYLVERILHLKISTNNKQKVLKAREVFNASKQREEMEKHKQEMRKKKEDKKRQEEAWLRSLPPEKQKREDEKRKKKEMNKMMKGKSMKVM